MCQSKTGRIITLAASLCLLLALGCGLFGLAVQQRVITLIDINVGLGPFSIMVQAPRPSVCSLAERGDPLKNLCARSSAIHESPSYRFLLFWSTPESGQQSTRVLVSWAIPVREDERN